MQNNTKIKKLELQIEVLTRYLIQILPPEMCRSLENNFREIDTAFNAATKNAK